MSTVKTDAIETAAGGTSVLTLGTATQTLKIPGGGVGASKVLTSDAVGGATWAAASGGGTGGFHQVVVKTATDATYSPATDVTKIVVHVQGGGGGTSNTGGSKGVSGGAAGGYAMVKLDVTSATVINLVIGAGGAQGVGSEGVGSAGDPSSATYVSGGSSFTPAIVGNGGALGGIQAAAQAPTIGGTGTGPAGGLFLQGGTGQGWMSNDNHQDGGTSMYGHGGRCLETGNPRSQLGTGYGSGGSGANQGTGEGKDGQDGIIVIYEYK
jgi:hypothetical protein